MRSIWKGSIGFGLVSIPVKLFSAVQSSSLDLDMLDSRDHSRIRYMRVNEHTHKEVPYDKIVKGYKLDDSYVVLEEKDYELAAPEKSKVIEIESFVDMDDVDPMYYETSYYTEPDTKNNKAYALLTQALIQSKKAGLARFVLRTAQNLCIVHPVGNVLTVTKIRFAQQIRNTEDLNVPANAEVSKKELDMGMALINQYAGKFDISKFKDDYNDELLKIIDQLMASLNVKKGA
jgi:DNA end-binding protein Ku